MGRGRVWFLGVRHCVGATFNVYTALSHESGIRFREFDMTYFCYANQNMFSKFHDFVSRFGGTWERNRGLVSFDVLEGQQAVQGGKMRIVSIKHLANAIQQPKHLNRLLLVPVFTSLAKMMANALVGLLVEHDCGQGNK